MVRGIWPYLQAPWAWAKVVDPRISVSEKTRLIQSLLSSAPCCTDFGFTLRLQSAADNKVEEFLPNGRFYTAIELLSCHRTINVAIKDCFARATGHPLMNLMHTNWLSSSYRRCKFEHMLCSSRPSNERQRKNRLDFSTFPHGCSNEGNRVWTKDSMFCSNPLFLAPCSCCMSYSSVPCFVQCSVPCPALLFLV